MVWGVGQYFLKYKAGECDGSPLWKDARMRIIALVLDFCLTYSIVTSVILIIGHKASAQTAVSASQNTPLSTTSAGDVTIASGGSIDAGGGAAVTQAASGTTTAASAPMRASMPASPN